jgi:hypothetical protein
MDCAMESGIEAVEKVLQRAGGTATYPEQLAALPSRT